MFCFYLCVILHYASKTADNRSSSSVLIAKCVRWQRLFGVWEGCRSIGKLVGRARTYEQTHIHHIHHIHHTHHTYTQIHRHSEKKTCNKTINKINQKWIASDFIWYADALHIDNFIVICCINAIILLWILAELTKLVNIVGAFPHEYSIVIEFVTFSWLLVLFISSIQWRIFTRIVYIFWHILFVGSINWVLLDGNITRICSFSIFYSNRKQMIWYHIELLLDISIC